MKKVIAAAAGLMIAGSAMVASAAVEFSGDARARYTYFDAESANNERDAFDHRIRLKVKGTTEGGAYAVTRLRIQDTWGTSGNISDNRAGDVTIDWAYVGTPVGCAELTAGRQPLSIATSYLADAGVDNVRLTYAQDGTTLMGLYGVVNQDNNTQTITLSDGKGNSYEVDIADDETKGTAEDALIAVAWKQDWNEDWSTIASLAYANFDYTDLVVDGSRVKDAFMGVVGVNGQAGPVAVLAELGYQEKGIAGTDDLFDNTTVNDKDAVGFYATAGMDFDALDVTLLGAYAGDGYVFDSTVGLMMIGSESQIALDDFYNIGGFSYSEGEGADKVTVDFGDLFMVALKTSYQATEDVSFLLNLGYVNVEADAVNVSGDVEGNADLDLFEISGQAAYAVTDGAILAARAGYLDGDELGDTFAAGVALELKF